MPRKKRRSSSSSSSTSPRRSLSPGTRRALDEIRRRWEDGRRFLDRWSDDERARQIRRAAERRGISTNPIRENVRFARTYSEADLEKMLALFGKHDHPLAPCLVRQLTMIPRRDRQKLFRAYIRNGWSVRDFVREVKARYSDRWWTTGPPPQLPSEAEDLYRRIVEDCDRWASWYETLARQDEEGNGETVSLQDLTPTLRKRLREAQEALQELRNSAERRLSTLNPP